LPDHGSLRDVAQTLARVFVSGPWCLDDLVDRGGKLFGRRWRWLRPLARRVLAEFDSGPRPPARRVAAFLIGDDKFHLAWEKDGLRTSGGRWLPPVMSPVPGAPSGWGVPAILTPGALADRLGLTLEQLEWFADRWRPGSRPGSGPLCHYRYQWRTKRSSSPRLIESPKPKLKAIQRRLLREILDLIPPHDAAHGFRAGRSVRTFVAPHVGKAVVVKMDLRDFFPSITDTRVSALFRTAGYPEHVARLLAALCTNGTPAEVFDEPGSPAGGPARWAIRRVYDQPHLPQGAPTSPALANLCAFRLDCRLAGLARVSGAEYTRYADDLVFSGGPGFARSAGRFPIHVGAIALEESFTVQHRKTRVMRRGVRQQVAGVVVNVRLNLARSEYDALKALLFNCVRFGPQDQNRAGHADFRAHLAGRIAYVASMNPTRGDRLRELFDRIAW
jgi:RNA-directed DNA polymerase